MKIQTILPAALLALAPLSGFAEEPTPAPAAAAPARSTAQVSLRVEAKNVKPEKAPKQKESKDDKKKDDKPKEDITIKALDIQISAAKTINGPLKLVTTWYSRDLATRKETVAKKEENEVALDATKTAKLSIAPYSFISTDSYKKKGSDGKMEKIDASGETYVGWVVRAYEGETLVGEAASTPPLLKQPY